MSVQNIITCEVCEFVNDPTSTNCKACRATLPRQVFVKPQHYGQQPRAQGQQRSPVQVNPNPQPRPSPQQQAKPKAKPNTWKCMNGHIVRNNLEWCYSCGAERYAKKKPIATPARDRSPPRQAPVQVPQQPRGYVNDYRKNDNSNIKKNNNYNDGWKNSIGNSNNNSNNNNYGNRNRHNPNNRSPRPSHRFGQVDSNYNCSNDNIASMHLRDDHNMRNQNHEDSTFDEEMKNIDRLLKKAERQKQDKISQNEQEDRKTINQKLYTFVQRNNKVLYPINFKHILTQLSRFDLNYQKYVTKLNNQQYYHECDKILTNLKNVLKDRPYMFGVGVIININKDIYDNRENFTCSTQSGNSKWLIKKYPIVTVSDLTSNSVYSIDIRLLLEYDTRNTYNSKKFHKFCKIQFWDKNQHTWLTGIISDSGRDQAFVDHRDRVYHVPLYYCKIAQEAKFDEWSHCNDFVFTEYIRDVATDLIKKQIKKQKSTKGQQHQQQQRYQQQALYQNYNFGAFNNNNNNGFGNEAIQLQIATALSQTDLQDEKNADAYEKAQMAALSGAFGNMGFGGFGGNNNNNNFGGFGNNGGSNFDIYNDDKELEKLIDLDEFRAAMDRLGIRSQYSRSRAFELFKLLKYEVFEQLQREEQQMIETRNALEKEGHYFHSFNCVKCNLRKGNSNDIVSVGVKLTNCAKDTFCKICYQCFTQLLDNCIQNHTEPRCPACNKEIHPTDIGRHGGEFRYNMITNDQLDRLQKKLKNLVPCLHCQAENDPNGILQGNDNNNNNNNNNNAVKVTNFQCFQCGEHNCLNCNSLHNSERISCASFALASNHYFYRAWCDDEKKNDNNNNNDKNVVCTLNPIVKDGQEWQDIVKDIKKSQAGWQANKIEKIERVHNKGLFEKYIQYCGTVGKALKEVRVFHGTRGTDPKLIYNGGFDKKFSRVGGCLWYAINSSYSMGGYQYQLGNGKVCLFLCLVAGGNTNDVKYIRNDLILNVYKNEATYPAYLITYQQ